MNLNTLLKINTLSILTAITISPVFSQTEFANISTPMVHTDLSRGKFLEPQSKTTITRYDIEQSGVDTLIDALQLIPGFIVEPISGTQLLASYLGGPSFRSRRLQILIDGVSYFLPNLARINFNNLPIHLNDIERIEFIHGPSTAFYKENAFSGTINITTVDPRDAKNMQISARLGSQEMQSYYLQYASNREQNHYYTTSFNHQTNSGFDHSEFTDTAHDSTYAYSLYHRSFFQINDNSEVDVMFNTLQGNFQREYDNVFQTESPDTDINNFTLAM